MCENVVHTEKADTEAFKTAFACGTARQHLRIIAASWDGAFGDSASVGLSVGIHRPAKKTRARVTDENSRAWWFIFRSLCSWFLPMQASSRRGGVGGVDASGIVGKTSSSMSPENMAPLRKRVGSASSSIGGELEAIVETEDEEFGIV